MRLVVAEKPSVAKGIYPVIGATTPKKGYYEGNGYIVSWCYGHLLQLKPPDLYCEEWAAKPWSFGVLPMMPEKWQFVLGKDCKEQYLILKKLMLDSSVDEIICATDADREGECIFRYVYNVSGCKKPVKRLWISSLEESAVKQGFAHLKDSREYNALFSAGFSRAKADWLVGMNGSRLFSVRYGCTLNLGRVQTPTLAMIVKRDYDVAHFVKQKYFSVGIICTAPTGTFIAESDRIDNEVQADTLCTAVTGKNAQITSLKKEVKSTNPPKLYDLTTLQRECNKFFGFTAQQTLDALQELYEKKLATYPRTDSQYLSDDMEQTAENVISVIGSVFPELANPSPDVKRCINNKKVTGHHAIIPTENIKKIKSPDCPALSPDQKKVLYLLAAKLVMATSLPQKYESTKVTVRCADTDFNASGKLILEDGWKALESRFKDQLKNGDNEDQDAEGGDQKLPALTQGQSFENVKGEKHEHWTTPPKTFTEETLLTAMEHAGNEDYDDDTEKKGLGTPATRAAIIENLVKNEYIKRKGKQILATEKGVNFISVVPEEVKSPKLTAEWETKLQQIEHGKSSATDFMKEITEYVQKICATYGSKDESVSFHKENTPIGKCPKCGGEVKNGKFGYYCTKKCGMNLSKVYGKELTDFQLGRLLEGKKISFTANGRKTIVLPEVVENPYNGKTYFQWKTEKG